MLQLLKRFYDSEQLPSEFSKTSLQALYKNQGSRKDLSNYRFLHLKNLWAKCFEYLVMNKIKQTMYQSFNEAQIGGLPKSRTTEHFYVLLTCMLRVERCKDTCDGFVVVFKDTMIYSASIEY